MALTVDRGGSQSEALVHAQTPRSASPCASPAATKCRLLAATSVCPPASLVVARCDVNSNGRTPAGLASVFAQNPSILRQRSAKISEADDMLRLRDVIKHRGADAGLLAGGKVGDNRG